MAVNLEFDTEKCQLVINIDGNKFYVVGVDYGVDCDEPKPTDHLVMCASGYYCKPEDILHMSGRGRLNHGGPLSIPRAQYSKGVIRRE